MADALYRVDFVTSREEEASAQMLMMMVSSSVVQEISIRWKTDVDPESSP
jgi:hypothetical protein